MEQEPTVAPVVDSASTWMNDPYRPFEDGARRVSCPFVEPPMGPIA